MRSVLCILPLVPALASASTVLGFEDIATGAISGQPYGSYINLTSNKTLNVLEFAQFAAEGSRFIAGGYGATYEVAAVSGIALLGVSVSGIEGQYNVTEFSTSPWPTGTIVATISLYGGGAGTTLLATVDVGIPASNTTAVAYLFSNYTPTEVTRFVIADTLTADSGGFAVDAIVVSGGGAVPEPSTYGLALGGMGFAAAVLRRRAKRA